MFHRVTKQVLGFSQLQFHFLMLLLSLLFFVIERLAPLLLFLELFGVPSSSFSLFFKLMIMVSVITRYFTVVACPFSTVDMSVSAHQELPIFSILILFRYM